MIVPCMLPKPPMITMANALTITVAPAKGVSTSTGPSSAPAMPASAEAMTMVSADQQVRVDAHQAGGLAVLRHRAQRLAEESEAHEHVQAR